MKSRAVVSSLLALAAVVPLNSQQPSAPAPTTGAPTWTLAAVGDAIITRRLAQFDHDRDPSFQQMAKLIRDADAAFLNLEISLFRLSDFKGWPEVENGGNWELGPPEAASGLKAMGFDLFNRANNHTTDYGVEGMRMTSRLLDEVGIVYAGVGETLGDASRPGYFETTKGRIALVGLATTFTPMSRAGASRPDMRGRPGLNPLRVDRRYEADPATLESLRALAAKFGGGAAESKDPKAPVRLLGAVVQPGSANRVIETVNARDQERILREVRNAARQADYVIVTSHSHEPGNNSVVPPPWMVEFTKKCIDAGATTYIIHGPHQLRGVEIYKGRPIFYSLGNFIFQNETIDPMPADDYETYNLPDTALASDLYDARFKNGTSGFPSSPVWYESVVARPTFRGTELVALALHPIDLAQNAPRSQRGTPRLADAATGKKIIDRIAQQSAAFGTSIVYENGVGVWKSGAAKTSSAQQ
jgi:poly-gamma-glutamate capsule biosynthesis protein CapA/YwtB (metallophosphatase superfamily)